MPEMQEYHHPHNRGLAEAGLTTAVAVGTGAVGYWLGRQGQLNGGNGCNANNGCYTGCQRPCGGGYPVQSGFSAAELIVAQKDAELAQLRSEKNSAAAAKLESDRILGVYINPIASEIADAKAREAKMQAQIECLAEKQKLEAEIVKRDIQLVRQDVQCCCTQNANAIANVAAILNSVVKTVIPNDNVCPGYGNVTITPAAATTTTTAAA